MKYLRKGKFSVTTSEGLSEVEWQERFKARIYINGVPARLDTLATWIEISPNRWVYGRSNSPIVIESEERK